VQQLEEDLAACEDVKSLLALYNSNKGYKDFASFFTERRQEIEADQQLKLPNAEELERIKKREDMKRKHVEGMINMLGDVLNADLIGKMEGEDE
jgi:hypothetical protein